jgi:hypothetical protein
MRLSRSSVSKFRNLLDVVASATGEAAALAGFLQRLRRSNPSTLPLYVVHGYASNGAAHKMVQAVGGLSIGTPFCSAPLDFDIVFEARRGGGLAMLLSDKALSRATDNMRSRASPGRKRGHRNFWEIEDHFVEREPSGELSMPLQLALYRSMMDSIQASVEAGFGPGRTIVSETSSLPFLAV